MRCHQARRRMTAVQWAQSAIAKDQQLLDHLKNCPACTHLARTEQRLQQAFTTVDTTNTSDSISWSDQKVQVEAAVALNSRKQTKETSIMSNIAKQLKRRPRLSLSLGVMAVLIALAALVPFKYDQTVGYEVAFAGVDPELAMDDAKIDDLLARLGVGECVVDVSDCAATCKLKISELKSPDDARLVAAAFDGLENVELISDVSPVVIKLKTTLLARAKNQAFSHATSEGATDEEIYEIVIG